MIRYVSNAGVLFRVGNKTVGVDCLCKDPYKIYQDTPEDIRKELNPDVLIFTHEHGDHFCGEYVKEVWEKNPNVQVYSTATVIAGLEELGLQRDQLHMVKDGDMLVVEDMQVVFMETIHTGEEYVDVQNLTLLIHTKEKYLVVSGDAMACEELFERISKWSGTVDWMLIPFPYMALRSTRRMITKFLKVRNVFIMHLPNQKADEQHWREKAMKLCKSVTDGLPNPVFPECLGGWYRL